MPVTLQPATVDSLHEIVDVLASWQQDGAPVQLHPGDLGWAWRSGATELARDVRAWRRDGQVVAVGFGDGEGLIRMGIAPGVDQDEQLASGLVADLSDPARGVLPAGNACVEARAGGALRGLLTASGWLDDEPWTPLSRDLSDVVEACELRVEVGGAHDASDRASDWASERVSRWVSDRVEVQRASFDNSMFTAGRWHTMAAASPYQRARCLVGYDADGTAVATATVWSAGPGRPGLLEPLGVHRDHRGHGFGTAISVAAAAALREMGASSATVCTPSSNVVGVATYVSAGFRELPAVTDFRRPS